MSHAAYPGVVISVIAAGFFFPDSDEALSFLVLCGAFLTALLGLKCIDLLEKRFRVKDDAALCFILSFFFGAGILAASRIQTTHALWYKKAQFFLYGQTATMTDVHVWTYLGLALLTGSFVVVFFRPLQALNFDRQFSQSSGIECKWTERLSMFFLALAIVIGIRSVGVILMAGMLIAPAAAARFLTKRLGPFFILAALVGLASAFFGNVLSLSIPRGGYVLPTGPMILLTAASLCVAALLLSPRKGLVVRYFRALLFRIDCQVENALKALWKNKDHKPAKWVVLLLRKNGWADRRGHLTQKGERQAEKIVRLHRLWEVYLVDYLGQGAEKVHRNAEELEHLLTPELEMELTTLLNDPKQDPHRQPIPPHQGGSS